MSKSINKPSGNKSKKPGKKRKGGKEVDVLGYIEAGINAINSVSNIIQTISDNRLKSKEIDLEGIKLRADIEDKISQRENETKKVLGQYEVQLKEIEKSIIMVETQSNENIKRIELEEREAIQNHEYRMRGLSIIEKIVDVALEQYRFYMNNTIIIIENNGSNIVNTDLLSSLNVTINNLTNTIAQANIGGLLINYEEE